MSENRPKDSLLPAVACNLEEQAICDNATDEAIQKTKAKLRELDELIGRIGTSNTVPVFNELARELKGNPLKRVRIVTQLSKHSHSIISNLSRWRPRRRPNSDDSTQQSS